MANMFSGNTEKRIPKSFKECYETDGITQNLWQWCERLEKWGLALCFILGIIGIISIISEGVQTARLIDELGIDMAEVRAAAAELGIEVKSVSEVVVDGILRWSFYCFIEYCVYHVLALLVGALASIVQHTRITANITLYTAAKAENITEDYAEETNDVNDNNDKSESDNKKAKKCNWWIHQNYVGEMNSTDSDSDNAHWETNHSLNTKTLVCNNCGKKLISVYDIDKGIKDCPRCGRRFKFDNDKEFGECSFCGMRTPKNS